MEELWADSLNVAGRFLAGVQLRRQRGGTAGGGPSKSMSEHSETAARFALYADVVWNATATDFMEREKVLPKVFEALQDSIAGPADRAVAEQAALRYAEGRDPALLKLIREKRRNQDEWSALDKTLGQALSGSAIVLEQVSAIRRQMQILQSRNAAIDKQLQTQAPEYLTLVEPRSVDVEAARALMGPEEALLLVRPSHFGTHLLLVTRDELTWHRSDWNISKIEGTVHWLRWDVGAQVSLPGEMLAALQLEKGDETQAFDRTAAYHLYQQIIEPILPRLAGKKMLFVASGGPLAGLPFSLLVAAPPAGSDENPADLRATQWFGDAFELGHITSIRSLATLRERPRPAVSGSAFIGVGDPALAQVGEARSYRALRGLPPLAEVFLNSESDARPHADVSQLRKMPSLPGTAVELRRVGERLAAPASSLYMQQRATENIVRSLNFSGTRVVLFSTHALTSDESGPLGEPGLVLTPPPPVQRSAAEEPEDIDPANDGYLAASEVAALEMETEWVVLSACNTATGDENTNLSALARAFFYAGAGSILASHWPVSDDVAPVLIAEAVAPKNSKLTRGQALQSAMRDIRMNPENSEWAHPFFWAPFVLLGDSAQSQWSENRGD